MTRKLAVVMVVQALGAALSLAQEGGLPQGWTSFVISACEDPSQFSSGLPPQRQAQQHAVYGLVAQEGARKVGKALRWRFQAREAGTAELHSTYALRRECDALSLWVKNPLDHDLLLALKLVESDGSEYVAAGVPLRGEKGWRQLRFVVADYRLAAGSSDENGVLDFPLSEIAIVAENAVAGQAYELYLDEIEGQEAPVGVVRVESFSAPVSAPSGEALQVELALSAPRGGLAAERLELGLSLAGVEVASVPLALPKPPNAWGPGELVRALAEGLRAPSWAAGGLYDLRLRGRRVQVENAAYQGGVFARVKLEGVAAARTEATVSHHGGVPTLLINGQPQSCLGYVAAGLTSGAARQLGAAGLHLLLVPATSDYDLYGLAGDVWLDEETFDYSDLDRRVRLILDADPAAYLLLRVYLCSPPWWDRQHPNECVLFGSGRHAADMGPQARKNTYPCWSSEVWRRDAGEALQRFVRHVEGSPYGDRVMGYQLASGATGSWDFWGVYQGHLGDYSPPEKAAFQRWLSTKYANDRRAFLEAWGPDPARKPGEIEYGRRFSTAAVPSQAARLQGAGPSPHAAILDPAYDQPLVDYQLFSAERTAETIEHFAQLAKEASGGRKLVGAGYGHIFDQAAYAAALQNAGHLALAKLLRSPSIDFVAGRAVAQGAVGGYSGSTFAAASVQTQGKLWFDGNVAPAAAANVEEGIVVQRRQFSRALAQGVAVTWLDLGSWGNEAQMQAAVGEMSSLAKAFLSQDRRSAAEVALVVDERSLCYTKAGDGLVAPLLVQQAAEMSKLGAPFDVCLLPDVIEGKVGPYRMYVFAGTLVMDEAQRQGLHAVLAAGRRTAVWIYAPGCIDELQLPKQVKEVTGVRVTLDAQAAPLQVKIADMADPYTEGLGGVVYGTQKPVAPVYYIIDDEARELGEMVGKNRPGLCVTEGPGGFVSIYSVAPALPARLLRNIARQAGVHVYDDGNDVLYGGRRILALWPKEPGRRTLRFPTETSLYDLLTKEQLAQGVRELEVSLPGSPGAGHGAPVALYFLGDGSQLWGR